MYQKKMLRPTAQASSCSSSSKKIMANKLEHLELDSRALKAKLICQDCHRNPRPEVQLYICMYCNVYKCGICRDKNNYCLNGHVTFLEPTLTMITSAFTT